MEYEKTARGKKQELAQSGERNSAHVVRKDTYSKRRSYRQERGWLGHLRQHVQKSLHRARHAESQVARDQARNRRNDYWIHHRTQQQVPENSRLLRPSHVGRLPVAVKNHRPGSHQRRQHPGDQRSLGQRQIPPGRKDNGKAINTKLPLTAVTVEAARMGGLAPNRPAARKKMTANPNVAPTVPKSAVASNTTPSSNLAKETKMAAGSAT